mmetsp:Transcript_73193/g.214549  ORF Transcript_73193/g.214549 Transcript_73193/m.214549 type:complete len:83 (-) Transcript_73193:150-398(-)
MPQYNSGRQGIGYSSIQRPFFQRPRATSADRSSGDVHPAHTTQNWQQKMPSINTELDKMRDVDRDAERRSSMLIKGLLLNPA